MVSEACPTNPREEASGLDPEAVHFSGFDPSGDPGADLSAWTAAHLDGPLLDLGAGAGRHALHFQERFETVAVEVSDHLVGTMRARGVRDARRGDMFALRESFGADRFRSALSVGTQTNLARSRGALRAFLTDLAHVVAPGGTAVLDSYDPRSPATRATLGYREAPEDGLGHRVFHFEYGGDVGRTLLFRYPSPDRFRATVADTDWELLAVRGGAEEGADQYRVALRNAGGG